MRKLGATAVVAALAIIGPASVAAPASAATSGFGFAEALKTVPRALAIAKAGSQEQTKVSCQSGDLRAKGSAKPLALGEKLSRKWLPVACEQPPRSQLLSDALKHASAAALSLYG